ncbi:hypothetical protein A3K86_02470 [Photobacterium jeanii]|uniref:Twin-arginine translocase subunit TatB n=1 Tax=Photobacterium jeanii TaxID=858640 RepID=A0A178KMA1_9GAMM|nr:hypothetical protein [Photobacterium jeanii]OAN17803.1 hypothetical protein A3K86_02470 [Photobacterium jeanii]PST92531.1 hypothetical protein C9I91_05000 [Photobacterium jeanii]
MFDIGFWEMGMIAVVTLVIMGPQQMTKAIRSILNGIKKVKDMSVEVSSQLNKELEDIEASVEDNKK